MDIDEKCQKCKVGGYLYYCYRCQYFYCHAHIPFHSYWAVCRMCRKIICLDFYNICAECDIVNLTTGINNIELEPLDELLDQLKINK